MRKKVASREKKPIDSPAFQFSRFLFLVMFSIITFIIYDNINAEIVGMQKSLIREKLLGHPKTPLSLGKECGMPDELDSPLQMELLAASLWADSSDAKE